MRRRTSFAKLRPASTARANTLGSGTATTALLLVGGGGAVLPKLACQTYIYCKTRSLWLPKVQESNYVARHADAGLGYASADLSVPAAQRNYPTDTRITPGPEIQCWSLALKEARIRVSNGPNCPIFLTFLPKSAMVGRAVPHAEKSVASGAI